MEMRNARHNASGGLEVEINHPKFGWRDIALHPDDPDPEGQELWKAAQDLESAPYVPPTDVERREAWRPTAFLTRMDFVIACKRADILTTDEAIAAAKGDWPTSFADALADPDVEIDPDEAQIVWAAASQVERRHPLIGAIQTHRGMSPEEVDALFGYPG